MFAIWMHDVIINAPRPEINWSRAIDYVVLVVFCVPALLMVVFDLIIPNLRRRK